MAADAPATPAADNNFDLIVIGSGPGGYTGAIRAAQLGLKTAIVEKEKTLGGTCLNVGCIPSKALLESSEHFSMASHGDFSAHGLKFTGIELDLPSMMSRKNKIVKDLTGGVAFLMKKNKITVFNGWGGIKDKNTVVVSSEAGKQGLSQVLTTKNIMIATGSVPIDLPFAKADGKRVITSTEALALPEVPEHLIVIGGGVIGLELGSEGREDKKKGTLDGSIVLVCVGRKAYTEGLGLEGVGVERDNRGRVVTDTHLRTKVPNIFAIGDAIVGPMLAHKAEDEGVAVAEFIATGHGHVNYDTIPNVIYTWPELASVGLTEEQLKEKGIAYNAGSFPFAANGRAKAIGMTDGSVKILADAKTDKVLGVHILGPRASDVLAEAVMAMEFGGSSEDIGRSFHGHPTLSEVVREAALAVDKRARQS
jgi:dihydrolipoamide dehydrogenase